MSEEKGNYTVAIYLIDRAYGGSEEGGWWYDCGEPQDEHCIHTKGFTNMKEAHDYANELNGTICVELNIGRREIASVLSNGRYEAQVHEGNPKKYPERKPHYE